MSKNLYCPKCNIEYWGEAYKATCQSCNYVFTNKDKQQALGFDDFTFKLWLRKVESCRVKR
jgi:transposase-like protein